tara:strand:+ start:1097 stop:1708 length:612 start_codon:yes stop_codon:yes gene_type:complete
MMNKGQIRAHFLALLNRTDCSDTLADTFVEQAIGRAQRVLRIPSMEKTLTYSISSSTTFLTLPADFLEVIDIYYASTNLSRIPQSKMVEIKQGNETGTPKFFSREAGALKIYPYPTSGSVTLNYYAQFTDMVLDTDENALAEIATDLITYGALSYASDYFLDERAQLFEGRFVQFLSELQEQANDAEVSGTVQSMQPVQLYIE